MLPSIGVSPSRMRRIRAAKVVVLPEPVSPAMMTAPCAGVLSATIYFSREMSVVDGGAEGM